MIMPFNIRAKAYCVVTVTSSPPLVFWARPCSLNFQRRGKAFLPNHLIFASRTECDRIDINLAKSLTKEIVKAGSWEDIFNALERRPEVVNLRHLTTALYFASKKHRCHSRQKAVPDGDLSSPHHGLLNKLKDLERQILESKEIWSSTSVANVMQVGAAVFPGEFNSLLAAAQRQLLEHSGEREMLPKDIVSILTSLMLIPKSDSKDCILRMIYDLCRNPKTSILKGQGGVRAFTMMEIGPLCWALTEVSCPSDVSIAVFEQVMQSFSKNELPPSSFALMCRMVATRGSHPQSDVEEILLQLVAYLKQRKDIISWLSNIQDSSMVLFSLAKLLRDACTEVQGGDPKVWTDNLTAASSSPKWNDSVLAARSNIDDLNEVIEAICRSIHSELLIVDANQECLSSILYSMALLQQRSDGLITTCISKLTEIAETLSLRTIATVSWSLSVLRYDDNIMDMFATLICCKSMIRGDGTNKAELAQPMAMILYSFASLNRFGTKQAKALLEGIVDMGEECLPYLSPESLPTFGWSLVVAVDRDEMYLQDRFRNLLISWRNMVASRISEIPQAVLPMVHHVEIAISIEAQVLGLQQDLPYGQIFDSLYQSGRIRRNAMSEWNGQLTSLDQASRDAAPVSFFQREVFIVASSVCRGWTLEYWNENLQYPVDMAIVDQKVVIEADGPTHFTANTNRPLGATALKRRVLTKLGWTVIDVPYFEWNIKATNKQHAEYLLKRMNDVGLVVVDGMLCKQSRDQMERPIHYEERKPCQSIEPSPDPSHDRVGQSLGERAQTLDGWRARQGKLSLNQAVKNRILRKTN